MENFTVELFKQILNSINIALDVSNGLDIPDFIEVSFTKDIWKVDVRVSFTNLNPEDNH